MNNRNIRNVSAAFSIFIFLFFIVGCASKIIIDLKAQTPKTKIIDIVPFVLQKPNLCGPASAEMVLKYHGVTTFDQVKISSCDSENAKGTHWLKLVSYLNWYGEKDGIVANTDYGDIDLLKKYIVAGYPVVVRQWYNSKKKSRHYRVVVGYNDGTEKIIYHDPKQRANMEMDYKLFTDLWNIQLDSRNWSSKNLMIIIGKKIKTKI